MIYVQTNDAERNEVVAFRRGPDGRLTRAGAVATGGRGTGEPHLPSQGSVVAAGRRVLVANAGSGDVSLLAVEDEGLRLLDVAPSGERPTSIALQGDLAYALDNGGAAVLGFRVGDELALLEGSRRALSRPDADPAQASFSPDGRTLVVTERGRDAVTFFAVGPDGLLDGGRTVASAGATPYGFAFAGDTLVVTEAFGASSAVPPPRPTAAASPSRRRSAPAAARSAGRWRPPTAASSG